MDIQNAVTRINGFVGQVVQVTDPESASGTKVALIEYPQLIFGAGNLIPVFADLKELAASVKNMTDEEKKALVAQFQTEFSLPNEVAEARIERTFAWIVETADFVFDITRKEEV